MPEKSKISFFIPDKMKCPVCDNEFEQEKMRTGGGRLSAGEMSEELRRFYIPNEKYGEIFPLVYPVFVCPHCLYAAYPKDFDVPEVQPEVKENLLMAAETRQKNIRSLFPGLDFTRYRTLEEGLASYALAIECYDVFPPQSAPTVKQGLSAIRAAWICNDLHTKFPQENYDYLANVFYRKASFLYEQAIEKETKGKERIEGTILGPDTDYNFAFEGLLYVNAILQLNHGQKSNPDLRIESLKNANQAIARMFGFGKSSKDKPSKLLDKARDLFNLVREEIESLEK